MDLNTLYDRLTRHEGNKARVYDDATGLPIGPGDTLIGHPTIGIGHALDVNDMPLAIRRSLLVDDVSRTIAALRTRFAWFDKLDGVRQEVIVNMAFNLGVGGLAGFTKTIQAIERGEWDLAAKRMLVSTWAMQVGGRAVELAKAMEQGRWPQSI